MASHVRDLNIKCIECNTRKARYVDKKCEPCHKRSIAEGTQRSLKQQVRDRWRKEARRYNRLIRSGLDQFQAAKKMGVDVHTLRKRIYKWKTEGGIPVIPMGRPTKNKPRIATTQVMTYPREHGRARWGIKNCNCEPCVTVREIHRAIMREKVAQRNAAQ